MDNPTKLTTEEFLLQLQQRMAKIQIAAHDVRVKLRDSPNHNPRSEMIARHVTDTIIMVEHCVMLNIDTEKRRRVIEQYLDELEVLLDIDE